MSTGRERQNRWTVLFRLVLVVPAFFILAVYNLLLTVAALLGWFAALITGRMPLGLRNAGALVVGYLAQTYAYLLIVTDAYPNSGPAEPRPAPAFPRRRFDPRAGGAAAGAGLRLPMAAGVTAGAWPRSRDGAGMVPAPDHASLLLGGAALWAWAAHALWASTETGPVAARISTPAATSAPRSSIAAPPTAASSRLRACWGW